jgi:hypothetical protein
LPAPVLPDTDEADEEVLREAVEEHLADDEDVAGQGRLEHAYPVKLFYTSNMPSVLFSSGIWIRDATDSLTREKMRRTRKFSGKRLKSIWLTMKTLLVKADSSMMLALSLNNGSLSYLPVGRSVQPLEDSAQLFARSGLVSRSC